MLSLTSVQKKQLETWRHDCRYSYNKCISILQDDLSYSKLDLRNLITPKEVNCRIPWILDTPKALREASVFEARKNVTACQTNLKNKNIKHFTLKFQSKKSFSWTISGFDNIKVIDNKRIELYPKYNIGYFRTKEKMPNSFKTCGIHFNGRNYFLLVPIEKQTKIISNRNFIISSDPGIRTFQTFYDSENEKCFKIGDKASEIMYKHLLYLDRLISKNSKTKSKKLKQMIIKKRIQIKNLQTELHWKVASWVCNKYSNIVIPQFGVKSMINKNSRNISTKTVRNMLTLSHSEFLEKLKTKAEELGTRIHIVNEAYTTRTCGNCFKRQNNIGGASEWICNKCNYYLDRDVNASRNILFKYFS
jgi:IS605 OrfB family transposase